MRALAGVGAVALVTVVVPASAQTASRARAELEQGYELRSRGSYVEALPHLLESYRLEPHLKTLINMADCEEHVGKFVDAMAHWSAAREQAAREGAAEIQKEAERRVGDLRSRTPRLKVVVRPDAPPGTVVDEDGTRIAESVLGALTPTDPGRHVLVVRADGHEEATYEVILKAEETRELVVRPGAEIGRASPQPEQTRASPLRVVGLAVLGVGVVSLGVGTYFGLEAISKKNAAHCPDNTCDLQNGGDPDRLRAAMVAGRWSTVFFVSGGVLGAAGATLLLLAPRANAGPRIGTSLQRGGGRLVVEAAW